MSDVLLYRAGGTVSTFTALELEALAAHLVAAQQAFVESGGVCFWRAGDQSLLLVDVTDARNRRLTEEFELLADTTAPFAVRLRQGASTFTQLAAIRFLGYTVADGASLSSLFMAAYAIGIALTLDSLQD